MPQSLTAPTRRMRAKGPRRFLRPLARARLLWQKSVAVPPSRLPATFFHDERDPNQRDKPRLDIQRGTTPALLQFGLPQPTDAMQKRYISRSSWQ